MSTLDDIIAALDELATAPARTEVSHEVFSLMESAARERGGLPALVARYGERDETFLLGPLTFLVARSCSANADASGATMLVQQLRCSDDSVKSNLVTALQLLAGRRALVDSPRLAAFLLDCLHGAPALADAAVPAAAAVLSSGVRFSSHELALLREAFEALRQTEPTLAAIALKEIDRRRP